MWLLAYFDLLLYERLSFSKTVDQTRRFVKTEFSEFNIITIVNAKHLKLKHAYFAQTIRNSTGKNA